MCSDYSTLYQLCVSINIVFWQLYSIPTLCYYNLCVLTTPLYTNSVFQLTLCSDNSTLYQLCVYNRLFVLTTLLYINSFLLQTMCSDYSTLYQLCVYNDLCVLTTLLYTNSVFTMIYVFWPLYSVLTLCLHWTMCSDYSTLYQLYVTINYAFWLLYFILTLLCIQWMYGMRVAERFKPLVPCYSWNIKLASSPSLLHLPPSPPSPPPPYLKIYFI